MPLLHLHNGITLGFMAEANFDEYWQLRMEGVTARLQAAQQIVSHPGTRGTLAENLLRELIREFLPQRWGTGTGFIMDVERGRSKQIDVLIFDQFTASPVYRDGELFILSPGTAHVAVEVKSHLDIDEIPRAYNNICSAKQVDPDLMGLIFAYDGVQPNTFREHVTTWMSRAGIPPRGTWPDQVYNMRQEYVAFPKETTENDRVRDDTRFSVAKSIDPVVRFFLTAVLSRLGLTNLRPFMRAERLEPDLLFEF